MNFADKLKDLRKNKKMSQEQLAEKLYVSRQAITKWENGAGLPDIENIIAIAALFNTSLDDLLCEEKSIMTKHEFLYESRTEYDLDEEKRIDINIGTAHEVIVEKTSDEKIQVLLASNKMNFLAQQVKVKIEEFKKFMDVTLKHSHDLTDMQAKEDLFVFIKIPKAFIAKIELSGIIENLRIRDISFDNLEFSGKLNKGFLSNCTGHVELDTSSDVDFTAEGFKGKVDFNQIHASSVLNVKSGNCYLRRIGTANRFIDADDRIIELAKSRRSRNVSDEEFRNYDFIAEIAGFKSELKIVKEG